jgi:hypothetical protein
MTPKVLLITDAATTRAGWVLTALRLMGFTAERAYTYQSGSEVRLALPNAEHRLDIDDASLRNRLREYHAVLIAHPLDSYSNNNPPISYTFRFLGWNAPQDPPFAYFGIHFATNRTAVAFPSDFPLVRPDRANLASTAHKIGPNVNNPQTQTLRVRLTRENAECYLPIITDRETNDGFYVWRLDTTAHNALGSAGEVLAEVIGEDYVFDEAPICAYRYKNCYLLPRLARVDAPAVAVNMPRPEQAFWLLYALKCIGLAPRYALPMMMMLDDVQDIGVDTAPRFTGAPYVNDWLRNRLMTYEWYATEFFPRTQVPLWAAITTGGRYGTDYIRHGAWNLFMRGRRALSTDSNNTADEALDATGVSLAQQMLQLFVREQNRSMRFCWHDHRNLLRTARSLSRHTDAGYPLAAPNDVPVAHGQMVRTGHIPPPVSAVEIEIDGEVYYDIAPTMSGSAEVVSYTRRSLHAARILAERNRAEMHALGFADGGVGGADRFQITAGGGYGSPAVMQALYESGVRIVRPSMPTTDSGENTQTTPFVPIRGVWVWSSDTLDGHGASSWLNSYGLYDAANPTRSYVGSNTGTRDPGGDISSIWTTDPVRARRRAYRRLMGYLLDGYLGAAVYPLRMAFSHPPTLLGWCDPADPLRRFNAEDSVPSGSPGPYINMLLEFWLNFEVVYRVLSGYLTPATGALVIATRERWMGGG